MISIITDEITSLETVYLQVRKQYPKLYISLDDLRDKLKAIAEQEVLPSAMSLFIQVIGQLQAEHFLDLEKPRR